MNINNTRSLVGLCLPRVTPHATTVSNILPQNVVNNGSFAKALLTYRETDVTIHNEQILHADTNSFEQP